jgi:hypothetical protein
LEVNNVYPKFCQFADFIVKDAIITCNPVSPFAVNDERKSKKPRGNKLSAKLFTIVASERVMEIMCRRKLRIGRHPTCMYEERSNKEAYEAGK